MNNNFFIFNISTFKFYVVAAGVFAFFGSLIIISGVFATNEIFSLNLIPDNNDASVLLIDVFGYIVLAPIIETFLIVLMVAGMKHLKMSHLMICIISALIWGGLHAIIAPMNFFGTIFSFFIFTHSYMIWQKHSFKYAYFAAALPNVILNSLVVLPRYFFF